MERNNTDRLIEGSINRFITAINHKDWESADAIGSWVCELIAHRRVTGGAQHV